MALVYKIIELRGRTFMKGRLRLKQVEDLLNKYSADGWDLDRIMPSNQFSFLKGKKDVYLVFFKMDRDEYFRRTKGKKISATEESNGA